MSHIPLVHPMEGNMMYFLLNWTRGNFFFNLLNLKNIFENILIPFQN